MFWLVKQNSCGVQEAVMQSEIIKIAKGIDIGPEDDLPIGFSDFDKAVHVANCLVSSLNGLFSKMIITGVSSNG